MIVISESAARRLVTPADALAAIERAFGAVDRGAARSFPVVRERFSESDDVYGVKSGAAARDGVLGLKIGGYWHGNAARGLSNHQSTTVLTDPHTGRPRALLSSNYLTGLRTAAACALAIRHLARRDTPTLGLIGAGAQSLYHVQLARLVRPFERLLVSSRSTARSQACAAEVRSWGLDAEAIDARSVASQADVLITLTPARSPVVQAEWLRPGTHVCAMGADTIGKRELDASLMARARVYVDDWEQAAHLGECQHAVREAGLRREDLAGTLGELVASGTCGRRDDTEITVFDSTGLAAQDLYIAVQALECAVQQKAIAVDVPLE